MCTEWLGGLVVLKYRSNIEQEQLGPHLRQLVKAEAIPDFLDYTLAEAKKTNFDVQTLGGLKQYLSRYQERGTQLAAAKASRAKRAAEDKATQRRMDYDLLPLNAPVFG